MTNTSSKKSSCTKCGENFFTLVPVCYICGGKVKPFEYITQKHYEDEREWFTSTIPDTKPIQKYTTMEAVPIPETVQEVEPIITEEPILAAEPVKKKTLDEFVAPKKAEVNLDMLNVRQNKLLNHLLNTDAATQKDYFSLVPEVKQRTAQTDLGKMVKSNILTKEGTGAKAVYKLNKDSEHISDLL